MTPAMYERVRNYFVDAGLTTGFIVQMLAWDDTTKLTDAFIVFRPNGGTDIEMTSDLTTTCWWMSFLPRISAAQPLKRLRKLSIMSNRTTLPTNALALFKTSAMCLHLS